MRLFFCADLLVLGSRRDLRTPHGDSSDSLDPKKKRGTRRAKLQGKSFSQAVQNAVDLYLDLPAENEDERKTLAKMASASADRSIAKLDETIACIEGLKSMRKARGVGRATPLIL